MPRVLFSGAVEGAAELSALEARVSKLHASPQGPFDALLCCGLGPGAVAALLARAAPFPVPLHFVRAAGWPRGGGEGVPDAGAL